MKSPFYLGDVIAIGTSIRPGLETAARRRSKFMVIFFQRRTAKKNAKLRHPAFMSPQSISFFVKSHKVYKFLGVTFLNIYIYIYLFIFM